MLKQKPQAFIWMAGLVLSIIACSPVDAVNFITPRQDYHKISDLAYAEGERHALDIYVPDRLAAGHPAILFVYGGRWERGSKADYLFAAQAFASRGYIVVIADYRLYPNIKFPAFVQDTAAAFVWTHNHIADYGGNPDLLFVAGHSAGAYNAMMLTVDNTFIKNAGGDPRWIKGMIGLAGPYNFAPFTDDDIKDMFSAVKTADTQPIHYVHASLPPVLLMMGDADTDVNPDNSISMAAKLRAAGDDVTLRTFHGFDHNDIVLALAAGFRSKGPVLDAIDQFIQAQARGAEKTGGK